MQTSNPLFNSGQARSAPPRTTRDVVAVVYRQAGLVALCLVVGTAVSFALYKGQQRIYASSAKVWVQTEQQGSPSFLSGIAAYRETPYPDPVNRKIETEIELMLTRTNAQSVIDKLHIRDEQLAHGKVARPPAPGEDAPPSHTVELFLEGMSVEPMRSKTADTASNVLEVTFACADPALAPVALQAFIDNYLQIGVQQNRQLGETTSKLIETQLGRAREDLLQAEDRIVALMNRDNGRSGDIAAIAGAHGAFGTAYAAAGAMTDGGLRLDLSPDTSVTTTLGSGTSPVVAALKSQALDLQLRIEEAGQLYTDDSENVRNLRSQLAAVQKRLAGTVHENTQLEAELSRLERQRQIAQERFVELQRKLDQIDLYLRLNPTEADSRVVVDSPDHPVKSEGKKRPIVAALGPLAGLLLGLLLATLRELGGERMRSSREVEWALGVPVIGTVPTLSARARALYFGKPSAASTLVPSEFA